ncbi:MAG TPA: hypothetical protein VF428_11590 [Casimicrobiaceae bacterium]
MIARPVQSVAIAVAVAAAFVLTGCGERPQAVVYKQGTYQGKTDQQPWSVAPWNGNKQQWEDAMRQRVQDQNEYKRMGG